MKSSITVWEVEERWKEVTVDRGASGYVRMVISMGHMSSDKPARYQGADLTPSQCRQLAHLLNAAALSAEQRT